jgi:hypothetical protein
LKRRRRRRRRRRRKKSLAVHVSNGLKGMELEVAGNVEGRLARGSQGKGKSQSLAEIRSVLLLTEQELSQGSLKRR